MVYSRLETLGRASFLVLLRYCTAVRVPVYLLVLGETLLVGMWSFPVDTEGLV